MFLYKIIKPESHPCSESQEELSFLICIQQFRNNFCNRADELLHHPIVLHISPLHHMPHGCRDEAQRRNEEAERRQQEGQVWEALDNRFRKMFQIKLKRGFWS